MNKLLLISFFCLPFLQVAAGNHFSSTKNGLLQMITAKDTLIEEDIVKEDKLIEEVIKSKAAPKKEKVQYFSEVTKYGFKNLFSNYSYNTTVPYDAQINPNAELFVQDYIRVHGNYFTKYEGLGTALFQFD